MDQRARAVICDDDPFAVEVARLVMVTSGFEVAAATGSLAELGDALDAHRPHVVVLDQHLSDGSGPDVVHRVGLRAPDSLLIVFSATPAGEALPAGVFEWVPKQGTAGLAAAAGRALDQLRRQGAE